MGPRKLLNGFFFLLPSGRLLELHRDPSGLDVILSDLGLSVSGECQMGEVPAEDTLTLKSVKKGIRYSEVYSDNDIPLFLECVLFILF